MRKPPHIQNMIITSSLGARIVEGINKIHTSENKSMYKALFLLCASHGCLKLECPFCIEKKIMIRLQGLSFFECASTNRCMDFTPGEDRRRLNLTFCYLGHG